MNRFICLALVLFLIPSGTIAMENRLPLGAGLCVTRVESLISEGKLEEAVQELEAFKAKGKEINARWAATMGYSHFYIDFILGNTCLMLADAGNGASFLNKAEQAYARSVEKNPELTAGWLNLAKCRYDLGQMESASHAFVKGYEAGGSREAQPLYYAAVCLASASLPEKALGLFNRLIQEHPGALTLEYRETLVSILFALDRYAEALPHIETLASRSLDERKKKWQEILLNQYLALGMESKALDFAVFLTGSDPLEPVWWKALAHIQLNRDRLQPALASLVAYGFLTPLSSDEQSLMADLFLTLDIPARAEADYERLLEQSPDKETFLKIIHACTRQYQADRALAWAEKGISRFRDAALITVRADILYEKKAFAEAADAYEALSNVDKNPGRAFLMLGYAAWYSGQTDRACRAFRKAAGFEPQKQAAVQALSGITDLRQEQPR